MGRTRALTVSSPPRGEALRLHVGRLRLAVRALRRADPPLPETHRPAPLPLPALSARFFALRSSGLAHEASPLSDPPCPLPLAFGPSQGLGTEQHRVHTGWLSLGWTLARTRGPTDLPKDQGLAPRQTWGSSDGSAHLSPATGSHTETSLGSYRPSETDLQINGLSWTLRYFGQRHTLRKLDPQTSSRAALDAGRGYAVRLLRDPGSGSGTSHGTSEAPHSGCEWLWVL